MTVFLPFRPTVLALAVAAGAPMAFAQTAATDAADTSLPTVTVSEEYEGSGSAADGYLTKKITGVGLWGERDLQDTPYSMSVVPEELIENVNAKDMDQIFKMNPTTQETARIASDATDGAWVNIRGFRVTNPVVNGMSYNSRVGGTPSMQDIERVEIINGATGFLYGGGRVGGAVNYVTKKPTLHRLRSVATGSYGGESYFGHVDVGGQFDDAHVWGYRLNALHQGGETSRRETRKISSLSLVLDYKPHDDLYTDLRLSWKDNENPGPSIMWSGNNGEIPDYSGKGIKRNQSWTPWWQKQHLQSKKIENSVRWKINDLFTLRTGLFYDTIQRSGHDARYRYIDGVVQARSWYGNPGRQGNDKWGVSAYLDSTFHTAGIQHTLTAGFSNSVEKNKSSQGGSSFNIPNDTTLDGFRNWEMPDGWGSAAGPKTPSSKNDYSNILIGDDIQFNEQWSALVGGNYSNITTWNYRRLTGYDKSAVTPTLSLMYKPQPAVSTYVTYIESLESGSVVSGERFINEDDVLDPYISKQVEIGAKFSISQRALLTASIFRIEKANTYDKEDTSLPPDEERRIMRTRDGLQVHQGVELGLTGKVTKDLTLMAGGTVLDMKIKRNTNPALQGKVPSGNAKHMLKVYAEYRIPTVQGLTVSGGAYYTGKKFYNETNTATVPAYTLFDAGMRYSSKIGGYDTTLNVTVQNIANKIYWSNTSAFGDPRTFALTVKTIF